MNKFILNFEENIVNMKILTFLTDFGLKSGYVAQMKGIVSSITPNIRLVDITHDITPHNIREGAFVLQTTVPYFPVGTVHVAVVDPGVGTERKGLIITTKSHILVGPDNGVLMPAAHFLGDFFVYEITNPRYMLNSISNTFHGRDIFAPVAAHILNGVPFKKIGERTRNFVDLNFGHGDITDKSATGNIIYIDRFGNAITNINGMRLREVLSYDKKIMMFAGNKQKETMFVKSYNFVKKGQLLTTIGSSNYLEIGVNQGNAAKKLALKQDDDIKILFPGCL
jgi:S-adenosylmethionine hydrolase